MHAQQTRTRTSEAPFVVIRIVCGIVTVAAGGVGALPGLAVGGWSGGTLGAIALMLPGVGVLVGGFMAIFWGAAHSQPIRFPDTAVKPLPCPDCRALNNPGSRDCWSCGVVL